MDDFEGEIFSSGSETFEDQMIKIRNDFDQSKVVDKKVTVSDACDDDIEEEAKVSKTGNYALHRSGESQLEPSPEQAWCCQGC